MTIQIDTSKFTLPDAKALTKALSSALNKTIVTAKKEMSSATRDVYNIKKKDLDPNIKVTKATQGNTTSIITIKTKPIGLIHFDAKATTAFDKGQKRYFKTTAKVMTKQGRKLVKGGFIAKAKNSGSWQVFRRVGSQRFPIRKLSVITATTMISKEGNDDFVNVIERDFEKNFRREFEYYQSKS